MWNTCELNKEYEFNNIDNNDYDNDKDNNNNNDDNIVHPLIDDVVSIDRPELVESGLSLNSSTVAKVIIVVIIVFMVIITIVIIMAITIIIVIIVIIIIMILYDVRLNWPAVALEEPEFDASSQFQTGQSSS